MSNFTVTCWWVSVTHHFALNYVNCNKDDCLNLNLIQPWIQLRYCLGVHLHNHVCAECRTMKIQSVKRLERYKRSSNSVLTKWHANPHKILIVVMPEMVTIGASCTEKALQMVHWGFQQSAHAYYSICVFTAFFKWVSSNVVMCSFNQGHVWHSKKCSSWIALCWHCCK